MSSFARQAVSFHGSNANASSGANRNGMHRFNQRRPPSNGGASTNRRPASGNPDQRGRNQEEETFSEPPIEGSIHVAEEFYPFSQITMSQGSAGENSFFSLRSSAVAAAAAAAGAGGAHANGIAGGGAVGSRAWRAKKEGARYSGHSALPPRNDTAAKNRGDTAQNEEDDDDDTIQSSQPLLTPLPPRNLNGALQRTEGGPPAQKQQRFSLSQSSSREPPATTPRRDKRARIQHPTLTMRQQQQQQQMPPPQTAPKLMQQPPSSLRQFPRRTLSANPTPSMKYSFNSSLVARSAHAVRSMTNAAMTPLRTFRLRSAMTAPRATTQRVYSSPGASREEKGEQPSPLDRPVSRRFEERRTMDAPDKKAVFETEEESVVECSVPVKQNGIAQFQLSQSSNFQNDSAMNHNHDDDDADTKTSASTYDPNPPKTPKGANDEPVLKNQVMDILSQIQNAKAEMESTKKELEEQSQSIKMEMEASKKELEEERRLVERKHRELMEQAEVLAKQRVEVLDLMKGQGDFSTFVDGAMKEIEAKANEVKASTECTASEFRCMSQEQQDQLRQLTNGSKKEIHQLVDESKARIQVCGKLEIESLESNGRVFKTELQELVDGTKSDLESKHRQATEELQKESRVVLATADDFKMGLKKIVEDEMGSIVADVKSEFEAWARQLKDGMCAEYGVSYNSIEKVGDAVVDVKGDTRASSDNLFNKENQKPRDGNSSKSISSRMTDSSYRIDCSRSNSLKNLGDKTINETDTKESAEKDVSSTKEVGSVGYKFQSDKDRRILYSDGDMEDFSLQELARLDQNGKNSKSSSDPSSANSDPSFEPLLKCVTHSDGASSPDSHESSMNSADDEDSLLNNASLAPGPFSRKAPPVQNKPTNAISSAYSAHSELRTGISVSTTPFSRKATPRIQNSYIKSKRRKQAAVPIEVPWPSRKKSPPANVDDGKENIINDISNVSAAVAPTKETATNTKSTAPTLGASKKRSYSAINNVIKSPRRSKRLRESARVEQKKQEMEEAVEASFEKTQDAKPKQVTPKDLEDSTNYVLSPLVCFNSTSPNVSPASSNESNDANDEILGTSVVVDANENPDVDLDGCESIVQRDVGPLAVPWGNRNSVKPRKSKSSYGSRKREKKSFAFDTLSSIFEFKF